MISMPTDPLSRFFHFFQGDLDTSLPHVNRGLERDSAWRPSWPTFVQQLSKEGSERPLQLADARTSIAHFRPRLADSKTPARGSVFGDLLAGGVATLRLYGGPPSPRTPGDGCFNSPPPVL